MRLKLKNVFVGMLVFTAPLFNLAVATTGDESTVMLFPLKEAIELMFEKNRNLSEHSNFPFDQKIELFALEFRYQEWINEPADQRLNQFVDENIEALHSEKDNGAALKLVCQKRFAEDLKTRYKEFVKLAFRTMVRRNVESNKGDDDRMKKFGREQFVKLSRLTMLVEQSGSESGHLVIKSSESVQRGLSAHSFEVFILNGKCSFVAKGW